MSATGVKNGRKMMYAFASKTSGKTCRVPWFGAVSLIGNFRYRPTVLLDGIIYLNASQP